MPRCIITLTNDEIQELKAPVQKTGRTAVLSILNRIAYSPWRGTKNTTTL